MLVGMCTRNAYKGIVMLQKCRRLWFYPLFLCSIIGLVRCTAISSHDSIVIDGRYKIKSEDTQAIAHRIVKNYLIETYGAEKVFEEGGSSGAEIFTVKYIKGFGSITGNNWEAIQIKIDKCMLNEETNDIDLDYAVSATYIPSASDDPPNDFVFDAEDRDSGKKFRTETVSFANRFPITINRFLKSLPDRTMAEVLRAN